MQKPTIGLTTRNENPNILWEKPYVADYVRVIEKAGGQVRLLPAGGFDEDLMDIFASLNGILLSGGGDIDPALFGGEPHTSVDGVIPQRDTLEMKLVNMAVFYQLPLLGICRGIQVMNVALGGTLYTHIPDQLGTLVKHHTEKGIAKETINHIVRVEPGSWLEKVTQKSEFGVNSRHHQGILKLADSLQVMATAPDGLIEAVIVPDHPFGVGVQWHPENMYDDPNAEILFAQFLVACGELM